MIAVGVYRYRHCGVVAGKLFMLLIVIDYLLLLLLTWLVPQKVGFVSPVYLGHCFNNRFHCVTSGWLCGSVVERLSLASELSLSCARPVADV